MDRTAFIVATTPRQARVDARAAFEVSGDLYTEEDQTPRARMKPLAPNALVVLLPNGSRSFVVVLQLAAVAALLAVNLLLRRR